LFASNYADIDLLGNFELPPPPSLMLILGFWASTYLANMDMMEPAGALRAF